MYNRLYKTLTTTTLLDASRTCTTGFLYLGAIFTAVCCLDVVAPPDMKYYCYNLLNTQKQVIA